MEGKKAKKILGGVGDVAITPPAGVPLLGCIQRSTGVHDNLFAWALVLTDGTERVVIVCLDLIGLNFGLGDELREAIYRHTGISHRPSGRVVTRQPRSPLTAPPRGTLNAWRSSPVSKSKSKT
jgi:hypothetical protein